MVGGKEEAPARHVEAVVSLPRPSQLVFSSSTRAPRARSPPRPIRPGTCTRRAGWRSRSRSRAGGPAGRPHGPSGARRRRSRWGGPSGRGRRAAAEAERGRAGQVELDGDGPALDQPSEAAELVEHAVERGQSSAPYVSHFATDTVAAGAARANGTRRPTPRPSDGRRADQELPSRQRGNRAPPAPVSRDLQRAVYRHGREVELDAGLDRGSRGRASARRSPRVKHAARAHGCRTSRHRLRGSGAWEANACRTPDRPSLARGVVELGRARVEEAHPVVAVAHQELGVLGQQVGVGERVARHGEPAAADPEDAEPGAATRRRRARRAPPSRAA